MFAPDIPSHLALQIPTFICSALNIPLETINGFLLTTLYPAGFMKYDTRKRYIKRINVCKFGEHLKILRRGN